MDEWLDRLRCEGGRVERGRICVIIKEYTTLCYSFSQKNKLNFDCTFLI